MDGDLRLYSYWRSSAAYRVRIGLNLKGLSYETVPVHLLRDGGEQLKSDYALANPQQLVPVLEHGQRLYRQSLAILEYIDEVWPTPPLLPSIAYGRAFFPLESEVAVEPGDHVQVKLAALAVLVIVSRVGGGGGFTQVALSLGSVSTPADHSARLYRPAPVVGVAAHTGPGLAMAKLKVMVSV